ncbi:sulfatase [Myxococcota bacterium]|nr:sulfatase [Myxococcota bacterium]
MGFPKTVARRQWAPSRAVGPRGTRLRHALAFVTLGAWLGLWGGGCGSSADHAPPNVLFIVADDLNTALGTYGHPQVQSPHIDRLAERGVRFDRAYAQAPICKASRTSFLTGLYPDQTGVVSNTGDFRQRLPDLQTLPQWFRNQGYFTARVGKIFHANVPRDIGTPGEDDPQSWDRAVDPRGRDRDDEARVFALGNQRNLGATLSWLAAEGSDHEQTDALVASAAIELMREHRSEPFFIAVGFYRPHTPFIAPRRYFERYPLEEIELVDEPADDLEDIPAPAWADRPHQQQMNERTRKQALRAYFAAISFVDAQVGRLLDAIDELDLSRRTVIVFVSDHGYHLGEHRLWQKATLFEPAARVPLIIAAPGAPGNGHSTRGITELVDLYPTLTELSGLPAPEHLVGRSLVGLLENPGADEPRLASTQFLTRRRDAEGRLTGERVRGDSIRTDRYRYTEWGRGTEGVELYDHLRDPHEYDNLAPSRDPEHRALEERMRALLAKRRALQR